MQLRRHPHALREKAQHRVGRDIGLAFLDQQHLDAGREQEGAEEQQDPVIALHQGCAGADHDAAQHQDGEDAPDQRAILVFRRDREIAEDHRDDEDIVDRERLLDGIASEILHAAGRAHGPPDPAAEGDGDKDVEGRQLQALGDAHLLVLLVEDAEIEGEQHDDDAEEGQPEPGGLAEEIGHEKRQDCVHGYAALWSSAPLRDCASRWMRLVRHHDREVARGARTGWWGRYCGEIAMAQEGLANQLH